jgi:multisubunit Na+/H+ antiporter MnhB subunit
MLGLIILLVLMIAAAIAAVEMKDLHSSVIVVGTVGLGLAVAFLILQAPNLAIVQIVVEILVLILLIRATAHREEDPVPTRTRWVVGAIAAVFLAVFIIAAVRAATGLPPFGSPRMTVAQIYQLAGPPATGAANVGASIALGYRAYDTLGETAVLVAAVIGAIAILRRIGRRRRNEP